MACNGRHTAGHPVHMDGNIMDTSLPCGFQLKFRPPGQAVAGPLQYALDTCQLGTLLVARSRHGVCAILIGDNPAGLLAELRASFPHAALQADARLLTGELASIRTAIDGGACPAPVTLDVGGTAFQQRVWRALVDIPAGQTRSYAELAQTLGTPKAYRAVGSACAANVLAVAIPCHRALRADGGLSGYRWGLSRKQTLLHHEQTAA